MKLPHRLRNLILVAVLTSIAGASAARAALDFVVTTQTSSLIGNPSGPFYLDFQFVDGSGSGDGNNTVVLSNFGFGGGSWGGPASVTLTDTSFFSEFWETFTPGSTFSFRVTTTTQVDPGGTPDEFSFAILDSAMQEIPTLGLGDALLTLDLNSAPVPITFGTDPSRTAIDIPAPAIAPVPEWRGSGLFASGVCTLLLILKLGRRTLRCALPAARGH